MNERKNRYKLDLDPELLGGHPLPSMDLPPLLLRGDCVKFSDSHRNHTMRNAVGYVSRVDITLGMFWVHVPAHANRDRAYRRNQYGPFMDGDIGPKALMVGGYKPKFGKAPDLDVVFKEFSIRRKNRRPTRTDPDE